MDLYRRALIAAIALSPFASFAQPRPPFTEIKPAIPTEADGKIEVAEFFWYGCIHCYNLEPALEAWTKKLPPDVAFRRIPAIFNERWAHDAAIFYTLESMGLLEKLHRPLFDAIHRDHLQTNNAAALSEWLTKNGVDAKKFNEALKSFGIQSKVRKAAQLTVASKVDGTPAIVVQGRYQVVPGDRMLDNVSEAIEVARKQK
jgi:thiol:disulfide interchange protein DsbA